MMVIYVILVVAIIVARCVVIRGGIVPLSL